MGPQAFHCSIHYNKTPREVELETVAVLVLGSPLSSASFFFSGSLDSSCTCFNSGSLMISTLLMDRPPLQRNLSLIYSGEQHTTLIVTLFAFSSYV
ncbi:hypothetical protein SLA2020_000710 [Shorea laevis]